MILVDATKHAAPAFWQGFMLIGVAIFMVILFSSKQDFGRSMLYNSRYATIFMIVWTIGVSVWTWYIY